MVGTTLADLRAHVDELATADGEYLVRCGRTTDRPVPVSGLRFDSRAAARNAVRAAEQYRAALRRYDPQVPFYDLIVCQDTGTLFSGTESGESDGCSSTCPSKSPNWPLSDPVVTDATPPRRDLVEFCHAAAAAVFETLSASGYDAVETAVMDAYLELAETVGDPDELCLCLLESMASELDERLAPTDQADIVAGAAARLDLPADDTDPLNATLSALDQRGLIEGYTRSPWSVDLDGGTGSVVVQVSGYALSSRDGRLPVLPLTLALCRNHPERPPQSVQVTAVDGGWQLTFVLADAGDQNGLVSAPIDGEM